MASILENIFGGNANKPTDETIAYSLLAGAAAAATAYLTATLDTVTPELRRLLNDYTNQVILQHGALSKLAVEKRWFSPYESPIKQLETSISNAQSVIENSAQ
ncbi:spore coat protein [Acetivibrio straminisolvens]|jgi:spore coat protein F|uniref:Spore coat protein F n=1 Tax=Acetivibrio straminisolvens JCM 21531 TaxID=1294263 RepID=W4V7D0_9FIRM|nr:spore coat protein [Acetivibrio straminisolvens]GAE89295.1 spore coat protein F [Acetivibrio straminisolvens JCM 21531]